MLHEFIVTVNQWLPGARVRLNRQKTVRGTCGDTSIPCLDYDCGYMGNYTCRNKLTLYLK